MPVEYLHIRKYGYPVTLFSSSVADTLTAPFLIYCTVLTDIQPFRNMSEPGCSLRPGELGSEAFNTTIYACVVVSV